MKLILKLLIIFLILFYFIANYLIKDINTWAKKEIYISAPTLIKLKKGLSLNKLTQVLKSQKLITSEIKFKIWIRFYSDYKKFKAGLYKFENKVSPKSIIATMIKGEIYTPLALKLTIPEASNIYEVCKILERKKISNYKECTKTLTDEKLLAKFKLEGKSFEGYLYPATYFFYKKPTIENVIVKLVDEFKKQVNQNLISELEDKDLNLYQALTFASLIEKEVALKSEYQKVSEVIWNRLNKNMALGIDASIIYGIKDFKGDLTFKHLKDKKNLYNSRIHVGLPPTPICSPTREALASILSPTNKGYLYYVHDIENGKVHHFSTNLKEHNKYVRKLKNW
jgi:UPF0755 protein